MFRRYAIDPILDNWNLDILPGLQGFLSSLSFWKLFLALALIFFLFKAFLGTRRVT